MQLIIIKNYNLFLGDDFLLLVLVFRIFCPRKIERKFINYNRYYYENIKRDKRVFTSLSNVERPF